MKAISQGVEVRARSVFRPSSTCAGRAIRIEGQDFTGFFGSGFDADKLRTLSHVGRVAWLRFRFSLVFMTPFNRLVALDTADCYVWLCVTNLLCGAVEALAAFEFAGLPMLCFSQFVEKYFSPAWGACAQP
jgi:hypothetical protein